MHTSAFRMHHCRANAFCSHKRVCYRTCSAARQARPLHKISSVRSTPSSHNETGRGVSLLESPLLLSLLTTSYLACDAASASEAFTPSYDPKSYYVSLGLFVMTVPGLWSLIKRAPQAKVDRKTYEVPGPAVENAMSLDSRARQIYQYFKKYNYTLKDRGEVVTFVGTYAADRGQAAALVFYTLISLAATALVLSITVPQVGNWWYAITLISPAAGAYYWSKGTRDEEVKVKMVTSDDNQTTDIIVEGDREELTRLSKELALPEKGKIYVKGILETIGQ